MHQDLPTLRSNFLEQRSERVRCLLLDEQDPY